MVDKTPDLKPIFTTAASKQEEIRKKAVEGIQDSFPMVGKKFTLDVKGVRVRPKDYGPEDYKKARLSAQTLHEPIRGSLTLKDNQTGKVVQKVDDFTLMRLPHMTAHHTFIVDGNPYTMSNQIRMRPGIYSRKKRNEELEAQFNLSRGSGFRMSMNPKKGQFNLEYGTSKVPLYPVLNRLGISDDLIEKEWNKKLVEQNQKAFGAKADKSIDKLYSKVVRSYEQEPGEDKITAIKRTFDATRMDPRVTQKTLGQGFDRVTPEALLATSGKLLRAYKENKDFDERDSLAFKQFMGPDDFIKERIRLDARDIKRKVLGKLDRVADIRKALPSAPFTRGIQKFITTSALSGNPSQINPIEIIDSATKITPMGEGGIPSDRAIPDEARRLHGSHAGILDPVRTPESFKTGVDLRTTLFAAKDDDGRLYTVLHNRKGKAKYVPVEKMVNRTVAFPNQEMSGRVDVMRDGQIQSVKADQVDYRIPNVHAMYGVSTNLIPFLDSIDGNRATMGSKMMTQALPLKGGEPPLIQVASYRPGMTMEKEIGTMISPTSPVSGKVTKIQNGFIYIKPNSSSKTAASDTVKVPFFQNFPLKAKTYMNDKLKVKAGDEVRSGQVLANSPFARNGQLSTGRNLRVAYTSMRGMNSNDAVVVSETAAQKLTSKHMYEEAMDADSDTIVGRNTHSTYYGNKYPQTMYNNMDKGGLAKPGTRVMPGDLLIAAVQKTKLSPEARMLGQLHKSLVKPYRDTSVTWEHDTPGVVTDVYKTGNKIRMTVKTLEPLKIGDKLAGRYGNKGVVSAIIPDDQMLRDENDNPIDLAVSPTSVVTRINPAQVLETALGRVAEKTGKTIAIENFAPRDNVQFVKDELKKHGLKDTETITDPTTGKKIKNVLVGPQYTMKLMKTTSTNFSARGVEGHDVNQQPSAGGPKGAKGVGRLEFNALIAHDARNILREMSVLKSQKNDEYWRAYQLGLPTPALKSSFAYDKFGVQLVGAGIKMDKRDNFIQLGPLTDKDVSKMSSGAIRKPLFVKAKDLSPEPGGLFDPALTGGNSGTKWSHVQLSEPMVNPVFERPVKTLLGMKQADLEKTLREEGGAGIQKRLKGINLDEREKDVLKKLKRLKSNQRNNAVKELKYVRALKKQGLRPEDAYVVSKVPVPPPIYRPIVPSNSGNRLQVSDPNYLLRDTMIANDLLIKSKALPGVVQGDARKHLYDSMSALYGTAEPLSPQLKNRNVQGYLARLAGAGRGPKSGFFHSKLLKKRQDISGRGTISPDASLAMDEVGLPEDAGWSMYSPFIMKGLTQKGFGATESKQMIEDRHPAAKNVLDNELKQRPVLINRAPSLYRYNVLAAYPKLVPGKTIRVHESMAPIQAGDFDGDAVSITAPVSLAAVEEARNMTLPNMLLSDQKKFTLTKAAPQQEAVMGVFQATSAKPVGKPQKFETRADAMAAYHGGKISMGTPVTIRKRHR
jgi:DNA-directed RNA polymerase beta subunit